MKSPKILCFIPVILFGFCIFSLIVIVIFESTLNGSGIYDFFAIIGIVLFFIGWLPAFCLSLAAIIISTRKKIKKYMVFSVVDIIISVLWFIIMFMGVMSV
ncbi:hypothetical protein [Treponema sp. C6A8]|uniref:hypothetical protein n=1 Tax=Treponema sp. C6A8 TaxID=1410609 RepID=UPI000482BC0C|nr:hypothetical protein [Treponema sp. C6A8]